MIRRLDIFKGIKMNSDFNPYSNNFNIESIQKNLTILKDETITKENYEVISILQTLLTLNNYYISYYKYLSNCISDSSFNLDEFVSVAIGFVNGNYANLVNAFKNSIKDEFTQFDITEFTVKSLDSSLGNINGIAAVEGQIDDINSIFSYLRYFIDNFKETVNTINLTEEKILDESSNIANIVLNSSIFRVLKSEFEETVWNDGEIFYDFNENKILFHLNNDYLAIRKIGLVRVQRLLMQCLIFSNDKSFQESHEAQIKKNEENQKKIKRIKFNKGIISIEMEEGFEDDYANRHLLTFSEMVTFYSFILDEKFPGISGLTVKDCIVLISHLKLLFQKITDKLNEDMKKLQFMKYIDIPSKILSKDLENYLIVKVNGKENKVKTFLSLITQNLGNYISFWNKPLLKIGDYNYLPFLPLTSPNMCYLIDEILEAGGFNLDLRGKYFEKFISNDLSMSLNKKGFTYKIHSSIKLKKSNETEEIDLILELKDIVLIAEIKCIKFSMTGRDYANALKTLKKAANQIKRKSSFIRTHNGSFDNLEIKLNKEILIAVINQYPLFTGTKIDEVPILDYPILESYFKSGQFSQGRSTSEGVKTISEMKYYENENTFSANLGEYLISPVPMRSLLSNVKFSEDKITPKDSIPSIFTINADIDKGYEIEQYGISRDRN